MNTQSYANKLKELKDIKERYIEFKAQPTPRAPFSRKHQTDLLALLNWLQSLVVEEMGGNRLPVCPIELTHRIKTIEDYVKGKPITVKWSYPNLIHEVK